MNVNSRSAPRRASGGLRARKRELALETILDAAEQVLSEKGLEAPMESIASAAGLAVGTLYNYFPSREALIEALLGERRGRMMADVREVSESTAALPFRERLLAVLTGFTSSLEQRAGFRKLVLQLDIPIKRSKKEAMAKELLSSLEPIFAQGQKEHVLQPDPENLQPIFLLALMNGALNLNRSNPDRLPLSRVPELVVRQLLDGSGRKGTK